jgi:hypothetical protein
MRRGRRRSALGWWRLTWRYSKMVNVSCGASWCSDNPMVLMTLSLRVFPKLWNAVVAMSLSKMDLRVARGAMAVSACEETQNV